MRVNKEITEMGKPRPQLARHPVAVKSKRHARFEFGDCDGTGGELLGIQHQRVAARLRAAVGHSQQPALSVRCIGTARPLAPK